MACVIATLVVDGKPQGANGFLIRMRTPDGKLVPGITIGDMGGKTIGNDLDNAWVRFTNVMLPKTALLNRYSMSREVVVCAREMLFAHDQYALVRTQQKNVHFHSLCVLLQVMSSTANTFKAKRAFATSP